MLMYACKYDIVEIVRHYTGPRVILPYIANNLGDTIALPNIRSLNNNYLQAALTKLSKPIRQLGPILQKKKQT